MCLFEKSSLQLNILNPQHSAESSEFNFNVCIPKIQQGRHRLEVFACLKVVGVARGLSGFLFILPNNNQMRVRGTL